MKIQFVNLQRQNQIHKKQLLSLLETEIMETDFIMGEKLEEFEKKFATYCKKKYCIGLNSGTDALQLSLIAYGVGKGEEVIVPANSYFSTAMVVSNIGAKPVFVDVDPYTYTIDVNKAKAAITQKTKAIIPVHLYGQPANMKELLTLAKQHNLIIIEDAAQAHGATYLNKKIPFGETGAFSFYPGKNLGAFGDGGAIVTDNKIVAEKILYLRNDGSVKKYRHKVFGIKSRLDTLQASILKFKLNYLDSWNKKRFKHAQTYTKLLKDITEISLPTIAPERTHAFHLFVISTKRRDKLQRYLKKKGIETGIHYPIPIHLQEAYANFGYKVGDFPTTEKLANSILSLPMFPELTDQEITYVCKSIASFFKKNK